MVQGGSARVDVGDLIRSMEWLHEPMGNTPRRARGDFCHASYTKVAKTTSLDTQQDLVFHVYRELSLYHQYCIISKLSSSRRLGKSKLLKSTDFSI